MEEREKWRDKNSKVKQEIEKVKRESCPCA
jgi:hypothetical protein